MSWEPNCSVGSRRSSWWEMGWESTVCEEPLMKEKGIHGLLTGIDDVGITSEILIRYLPELPGKKEIRIHSHSDTGNVGEDSRTGSLLEGGDACRDSCKSIITANRAQASGKAIYHVGDFGMDASKVTPGSPVQEALRDGCGYLDCRIGNDDLVFGNITSSTSSPIEGLKASHSLGSKSFDLKGAGCVNQSPGDDLLKICSCSLCLKALGKSQREVASVIQRIDSAKSSAPHGPSTLEKDFKIGSTSKESGEVTFPSHAKCLDSGKQPESSQLSGSERKMQDGSGGNQ